MATYFRPGSITPQVSYTIQPTTRCNFGLEAGGYDATYPRVITASVTIATLSTVGLYIANKIGDKTLGISVDTLLGIAIDWAERQFKKNPRQKGDDKPRRTRIVVFYGPDRKPLKEIEVVEDDDDDNDHS